jgi:hypothetical protein
LGKALGRAVLVVVAGLAACSGGSGYSGTGAGGSLGSGGETSTGGATGAGGSGGGGAGACHAAGTLNVTNSGMTAYLIDQVSNPDLTFCRGSTYTFAVSAPGHPFYIKTVQGTGTGNAYADGVTNNGATAGDIVFVVPSTAPATLFYDCSIHAAMTGTIHIVD